MLINPNRIAFIRRDAQEPPNTNRFMIVLRFIARIMIHHQNEVLHSSWWWIKGGRIQTKKGEPSGSPSPTTIGHFLYLHDIPFF
jgi:hypothetical protein